MVVRSIRSARAPLLAGGLSLSNQIIYAEQCATADRLSEVRRRGFQRQVHVSVLVSVVVLLMYSLYNPVLPPYSSMCSRPN